MADQIQKMLVNTDLRPAYYDDFHCLAAGCRYSCCKSWRVTFDKKDYLNLKRLEGSPEFNARLEGTVRRIRKDAPSGHYGEFDMSTGDCPFLREDCLCDLQVEKGHAALPEVCRVFPRGEFYSPGYLERSMSPACEEVLELMWNLPEGIEFRSDPLPREKQKVFSFQKEQYLSYYFPMIREWCIDMLQDRRFRLPDRLMMMGMGLQQLANKTRDIPAWLSLARTIPENAESILPQEPERHSLQRYLSNCLGTLLGLNVFNRDFSGIRDEIAQGIGVTLTYDGQERVNALIHLSLYQEAAKRYEERFGDKAYFLENLMVTLLFHLALPDASLPETIWKSYINLCNLYSFYRFMAVMSCREGASGDKEELFRLMVFASRGLIHNQSYQNKLRDDLFDHDSSTLAHMAILLCG